MVTINSCLNVGFEVFRVEVQIGTSRGYGVKIIGLTDRVVRESKHRILTALHLNAYKVSGQRIIINLSPSDLPKTGMGFDLPIAIGILLAQKQIESILRLDRVLFFAELNLNGVLKSNQGTVNCVQEMIAQDFDFIVVAFETRERLNHLNQEKLVFCKNIGEVIEFVATKKKIHQDFSLPKPLKPSKNDFDFSQILNQEEAVHAAQVAVLGHHHLILKGNPGLGKSMIAERISTLISRVDHIDKNEILGIYDLLNNPNSKRLPHPAIPFRKPDHTITPVGFKGGTQGKLVPGEASLAHGGVLFMDELNFFQRDILRLLQAVLDHRRVQLKKGSQNFTIPADFLCVTGFNVSESKYYPKMIPPSLIDRFDVSVFLDAVDHNKRGNTIVRNSKKLRTEINEARTFQLARNSKLGAGLNSRLDAQQTYELCKKTKTANLLFKEALEANNWSFRRQLKVLQLARSIADLGFAEKIDEFHLSKALTWAP